MCYPPESSLIDNVAKMATILIALANIFFAYRIFEFKDRKEDDQKERERKMQMLKTLILDHSLKDLFTFFDEISSELRILKNNSLSVQEKIQIDLKIQEKIVNVRRKFIDLLIAIDNTLYDSILKSLDLLQEHITKSLFDEGINLSHEPKYNEIIEVKLTSVRTDIIKSLFNYKG